MYSNRLILVMTSQLSKLLEWFETQKIEYLKNRTRFFHEIKNLNFSKTIDLDV